MKRTVVKKTADPFAERVSPQLATLVSAPPTRGVWVYEITLDGYRILARCVGGKARLFTRMGNDWTSEMEGLCARVREAPRPMRLA